MLHKTKKHFFISIQHRACKERHYFIANQYSLTFCKLIKSAIYIEFQVSRLHMQLFTVLPALCTFTCYLLNINKFSSAYKQRNHLHIYLHYLHEKAHVAPIPQDISFAYLDKKHPKCTSMPPYRIITRFHIHAQSGYTTDILRHRERENSVRATDFSGSLHHKMQVAVQTKSSKSAGKHHHCIHHLIN